MMRKVLEVIKLQPVLRELSPAECEIVAHCASVLERGSGEYLCWAGEPAEQIYLLLAGKASLESPGFEQTDRTSRTLNAGDVLSGEFVTPTAKWTSDARMLEPGEVIAFDLKYLCSHCRHDPVLASHLAGLCQPRDCAPVVSA
jgi:CRP-like cAMP-binding protein